MQIRVINRGDRTPQVVTLNLYPDTPTIVEQEKSDQS